MDANEAIEEMLAMRTMHDSRDCWAWFDAHFPTGL